MAMVNMFKGDIKTLITGTIMLVIFLSILVGLAPVAINAANDLLAYVASIVPVFQPIADLGIVGLAFGAGAVIFILAIFLPKGGNSY